MRRAVLALSCCLPIVGALELRAAGGTIQDQNVSLTYTSGHWSSAPNANLLGTDGPGVNPLFRSGWWYRVVDVDTREYPFPPPDSETYSNGMLIATWANVDGKGFSAQERTWVFDDEAPSGGFVSRVFVNWGSNPASHDIALFHFLDVDVAGSFTNDSATLRGPGYIKITDGASTIRYRAYSPRHYMVAPYDNLYGGEIKRRLNDTAVDDLSDTGLPFAPGDVTAGFQFLAYTPYGGSEVSVSSNQGRDYVRGAGSTPGATPQIFFRSGVGGIETSASWIMRRTNMVLTNSAYAVGREILTANDFDGNGTEEYLFRNLTTGVLNMGFLGDVAGTPLPSNWQLAATADFDGDGKADLLWRNDTSNRLVIWLMNGPTKVATRSPNPDHAADANWSLVGADDFNNDGHPDLLFYNQTSGNLVLWFLDANQVRLSGQFTDPMSVGSNVWRAVAVGDFGRGAPGTSGPAPYGSPDILWQNDVSKKLVVWNMDFAGHRTSGGFTTPDNCGASYPCYGDGTVFGPR